MIQPKLCDTRKSGVVRTHLWPIVATFIQQLASVLSCLYTHHRIDKRGEKEKVALAIKVDECVTLGTITLRSSTSLHFAPCVGHMWRLLSAISRQEA